MRGKAEAKAPWVGGDPILDSWLLCSCPRYEDRDVQENIVPFRGEFGGRVYDLEEILEADSYDRI